MPADSETGASNSFITESSGFSTTRNDGHNLNFEFEYKIDSMTTLSVRPRFSRNTTMADDFSERSSTNELGLINQSTSLTKNDRTSENFQNDFYLMRKFKKKGRSMGLTFNNANKQNDANQINKSETYFLQDDEMPDDIRNQRELNNTKDNTYFARLGYLEPITDSLSLNLRLGYHWKDFNTNKSTFNYNSGNQQYSDVNSLLSYDLTSRTRIFNPTVGFNIRKKKISLGIYAGTQVIDFENNSLYLGETNSVNKNICFQRQMDG